MRALVLSCLALFAMGSFGHAQDQTLRGVYAPPGLAPPAKSVGKSTLSGLDAVGTGPRVTISGDPIRGQTLPNDVSPAPIPDRPGYGKAVVNGRRVIVDLNNNRIYQVLD
jgi:Protein of unknown function (DUF1236)